jgi:hypothetical protein
LCIKQMPLASTIRSTKTRHTQFKHFAKLTGYFTFTLSRAANCNRPHHLSIDREIIDMPVKGLFLFTMTFNSCRKVPLSTSDIEIYSPMEIKFSEPAYFNCPTRRHIKHSYIYSGFQI